MFNVWGIFNVIILKNFYFFSNFSGYNCIYYRNVSLLLKLYYIKLNLDKVFNRLLKLKKKKKYIYFYKFDVVYFPLCFLFVSSNFMDWKVLKNIRFYYLYLNEKNDYVFVYDLESQYFFRSWNLKFK